jgi:hypothetical protein
VTFWIPGPIENPLNGSLSHAHWTKRSRWAKTRREKAQMHMLVAFGRGPRSPHTPKHITFRAFTYNAFDGDGLQAAIKPYRDALKDMRIIDDDRDSAGHRFVYEQEISRGKDAKRGVEISVTALEETR